MMNITNNNQPIIIGIDHGYGNVKTRNCCFKSGVAAYEKEPTFKENMLVYNNRYYLVGEEHKEFLSDKMADNDYYILTLAAIAKELNIRHITSAKVHIAAGLPLRHTLCRMKRLILFSKTYPIISKSLVLIYSHRASLLLQTDFGSLRV